VIFYLLKRVFGLASFLFVFGILETLGMMFYMEWANEAALRQLVAGGVSVGEIVQFLLASPDRLFVAAVLAAVSVAFFRIDSSGGGRRAGHGVGFGGGDGGSGDGGE
jgi:hypothetical protein